MGDDAHEHRGFPTHPLEVVFVSDRSCLEDDVEVERSIVGEQDFGLATAGEPSSDLVSFADDVAGGRGG
jgi:hypothetical protein